MIRCVIIDDEPHAIVVMKQHIARIPSLELVGSTSSPLEGIELVRSTKADVVFLDVQMDELSGLEVASRLDDAVQVIFCTAYTEFAAESYNLNAVDYLIKPISYERLLKALNKLKKPVFPEFENSSIADDYIFVKLGPRGKMIKVDIEDIDYIEGMSNYITIQCQGRSFVVYGSLKECEAMLPASHFARVHKSFIVALSRIKQIQSNHLVLFNRDEEIPLSRTYRSRLLKKLSNKIIGGQQ